MKSVPDNPPNQENYPNMSRRLLECRGVEIVHDKLIHKQYGIVVCYQILKKYSSIDLVFTLI